MDGYTILTPQVQLSDVDPDTGQVVPGTQIPVRDDLTGNVLKVFVPARVLSANNARTLIELALQVERDIHELGALPPAA